MSKEQKFFREGKEEHIDVEGVAGKNSSDIRKTWIRWIRKRVVKELRVAQEMGLLKKEKDEETDQLYRGWGNVVDHLITVNAVAVFLAEQLSGNDVSVNMQAVDSGSMLHDVTKRYDKERGVSYDCEQKEPSLQKILKQHGFDDGVITAASYTARVPEIYIENSDEQQKAIDAKTLEELIVAYSDARVRNTNIVSLEEARDKNKKKVPADAGFYDKWYAFYKRVEERIFRDLDIKSEDISNETVFAMVQEKTRDANSESES